MSTVRTFNVRILLEQESLCLSKINIARWLYCTPSVAKIQDCSLGKTGDKEQSTRMHFVFFFVFEFVPDPSDIHVETLPKTSLAIHLIRNVISLSDLVEISFDRKYVFCHC